MKKILAVSGGVDSMVILHLLKGRGDVVVAHFDHGARQSAAADAELVRRVAEEYGLPVVVGRGELGEGVSEAVARQVRYDFLRQVAADEGGEIWTAHHLNDLAETVAINLWRGTGWRGLAVLGAEGVRRPFLEAVAPEIAAPWGRREILRYAAEQGLVWREDPTNHEDYYLRGRLRPVVARGVELGKVYELWQRQRELKGQIMELTGGVVDAARQEGGYGRAWFREMDDAVALEVLREVLAREGITATRPQRQDFLAAIRTYENGKSFNLPGDRLVKMGNQRFYF